MDRRTTIKSIGSAAALMTLGFSTKTEESAKIMTRPIHSSGEQLPCVGLGTWQTFDVGKSKNERDPLLEVINIMRKHGGSVIDSSPMYGRSEAVVVDLSKQLQSSVDLFMATKVWTSGKEAGISQMNNSSRLMQSPVMDLMQVHNLVDWKTHLRTLREWKDEGKIRYTGITHYTESAYDQMESIMKTEPIDFIQINYSIDSRKAEERLLPLAADKGIAVLINRPYSGGSLFNKIKSKKLPEWSKEFDCKSWGNFFLKFILANKAVTCVIPGTAKPHHMEDNMQAGFGGLPSDQLRSKMRSMF